jgi:hypothetical protein
MMDRRRYGVIEVSRINDRTYHLTIGGRMWSEVENPDGVGPSLDPETMASEPGSVPAWTGNSKIDRIVALASEAIRHANKG